MEDTQEKQSIGFWMTSALVVGTMIGAGIFLLPVSLAPLGMNAVIGWVVSTIGALCIAFALSRRGGFDRPHHAHCRPGAGTPARQARDVPRATDH